MSSHRGVSAFRHLCGVNRKTQEAKRACLCLTGRNARITKHLNTL